MQLETISDTSDQDTSDGEESGDKALADKDLFIAYNDKPDHSESINEHLIYQTKSQSCTLTVTIQSISTAREYIFL